MKKIKLAAWIVLLFVVIFFSLRDAAASTLEIGTSVGPKRGFALVWTESVGTKWEVGTVLHTDVTKADKWRAKSNAAFFASRIVRKGKFSMGIGPAMWINTNRIIGCKLGYVLNTRYDLSNDFALVLRHWSNAGTCSPNTGVEFLLLAYRFD